MPKEKMLESIYWDREQGVLSKLSEGEKQVMREIEKDWSEEKLRELIEKVYNQKLSRKINKFLDLTLEDMLKRESETLEKYYMQGFKDGINLLIECMSYFYTNSFLLEKHIRRNYFEYRRCKKKICDR